MFVGGIDVGTTGAKITIFENGKIVDSFYQKYAHDRFSNGDELDAILIKDAVFYILGETLKKYPAIEKIGVTSFGETFVCLDKNDNILLPSFLYTSKIGVEETREIEEKIGQDLIGEITGLKIDSMFSLPKILYIKNNLPEIYAKIDKILLIEDYITYCLTGFRYIDYSLASRTMCFDVHKKIWSETILNKLAINSDLFSKPCKTGEFCGSLNSELLKKYAINHDVKVYAIAHDQIANAIGSGIIKEGMAVDGNGTCECISVCYDINKVKDASFLCNEGYCVVPYLDNLYVSYILNYTAGALIDWVVHTYFSDYVGENIFEFLNENISDNVSDLMVLPYFSGCATLHPDKDIKGAIVNLSLETSKFDIYKATLESLCFEMKLNIENFKKHGVSINSLVATGGGSKNDVYLQMKADILNMPIYKISYKDAGTVGAYILMSEDDAKAALNPKNFTKIVEFCRVFEPNREKNALYEKKFLHYKNMYKCIKGI